jgi:uncharacterized surface protein with fasciclin (FAS1) repeats
MCPGPPKEDMMKARAVPLVVCALLVALLGSACSSSSGSKGNAAGNTTTTVKARNMAEAIAYDPRLSAFATALNASGVLGRLSDSEHVTVFAPDNGAFGKLRQATLARLLSRKDRTRLAALVRAHIVKGAIQPNTLHDERLKTLAGTNLTIAKSGAGYTVSDGHGHRAQVELPPIQAPNAVIYPIDGIVAAT